MSEPEPCPVCGPEAHPRMLHDFIVREGSLTRFGFVWGPLHVERVSALENGGVAVYLSAGEGGVTVKAWPDGQLTVDGWEVP